MEPAMTINEDLWSARLPNGDVRSGTLEQLDEAFRSGHLGENTLVCGARSDRWVTLADALAGATAGVASTAVAAPRASAPVPRASVPVPRASAPVPRASAPVPLVVAQPVSPGINGSAELWQVRLANGEVRSGTRDQLAEALHGGHLDEHVLVLAAEAREWVPLGVVMRRSEPPAAVAAPAAAPPSVTPPVASPVAPRRFAPQPASAPPPSAMPAPPESSDEVWQVKLADGQVRSGTRDQLAEAFNAGHLDQTALVLAAGASEWVTLAQMMAPEPAPVAVQPAPPVVVSEEPAPVAVQPAPAVATQHEAPAAAPEPAPAAPAQDASSSLRPDDGQPDLQAAWDGDQLWRVNLSGKQLQRAFYEGLLDDDTLVLAAGTDEWIRLADARRAQSAPAVIPTAPPSDHDATPAVNGAVAEGAAPGTSLQDSV
jgi:hypothetical protein